VLKLGDAWVGVSARLHHCHMRRSTSLVKGHSGEEVSGVLITNIAQRARLIGIHTAGCQGFGRGYYLVHGRPTKILNLFFSLRFP
jgi:hypothetical protein